jgi:hypothetical protein
VLPLHHGPRSVSEMRMSQRKVTCHTGSFVVPDREPLLHRFARIVFLVPAGSVSHAVLNTSLGARSRMLIK